MMEAIKKAIREMDKADWIDAAIGVICLFGLMYGAMLAPLLFR